MIRREIQGRQASGQALFAERYAVYMEFLTGERELTCTAWGMPTYNTKGWKAPCYLITDGHYDTFQELMEKTAGAIRPRPRSALRELPGPSRLRGQRGHRHGRPLRRHLENDGAW